MARLLWLPDVLRSAGLTVHEVAGWRTRGNDSLGTIRGITIHATAGSRTSTDAGEIRVLTNGSATAPAPIAQLYLSRTGHWHVVASGLCYHNKVGWAGPNRGLGNANLLGIEAQHSNTTAEPWTDVQYRSYVRGVAALVRKLGVPVSRVAGHKEHQPYVGRPAGETSTKSDPTFDMAKFRRDVTAVASAPVPQPPPKEEEMDAKALIKLLSETTIASPELGNVRLIDHLKQPLALRSMIDKEVLPQLAALSRAVEQLAARPVPGTVAVTHEQLVAAVREVLAEGVVGPGPGSE